MDLVQHLAGHGGQLATIPAMGHRVVRQRMLAIESPVSEVDVALSIDPSPEASQGEGASQLLLADPLSRVPAEDVLG